MPSSVFVEAIVLFAFLVVENSFARMTREIIEGENCSLCIAISTEFRWYPQWFAHTKSALAFNSQSVTMIGQHQYWSVMWCDHSLTSAYLKIYESPEVNL